MTRSAAWIVALALGLGCSSISEKDLARAQMHMQLAQLKLMRGDLHYAVREYREALAINERSAEAHFGLGEVFRGLGSLEEARAHFQRALQIDPTHYDSRLNLSAVHLEAGRWDDAIRETTLLIKEPAFLNPARAYVNRAWAQYKLGHLELAEADLRDALHTDSGSFQAHLNLGIVLFDRGKITESMDSFERVVTMLEPNRYPLYICAEAEARFRLAQAYVKVRDRPKALEQLQKAEAIEIPCSWRDQARNYLAEMK